MPQGGFLVKFDEEEPQRAYAVAFDYDEWSYAINNEEKKKMPEGTQRITIEIASRPVPKSRPLAED